ncbi:sensory box sensor histidine kinase/response regulator [Roseobacter sp. SK209-2-6]|nr:sensory box sensor histidine kinase/response regulator [Roseobacter sp. SK209-2-6]
MEEAQRTKLGPVARHQAHFSPEGLFERYLRGQIRLLWVRLAYCAGMSALLVALFSLETGLAALVLTWFAELTDTLVLRYARLRMQRGAALRPLELLTAFSSLFYGALVSAAAVAPFWMEDGGLNGQTELILGFPAAFLTGATLNIGMVISYHRLAVLARLACYAVTPLLLLRVWQDAWLLNTDLRLQVVGLVALYVALVWFIVYAQRGFVRTRTLQLTQAMQQQELESAYQRLLEQQTESRRLALVARHANDSILMIDKTGRTEWVNKAFTKTTGYSFKEVYGQDLGLLLNHPDTDPVAVKTINEGRARGESFRVELLNKRKDGQAIWVETIQVPILGADGTLQSYIAIERDVTQAKEHADHLEEARAAAEEGARAKAEFLANMSHEIRTPMNGVMGMAQLLEETELDEDQRLYTDTILSSARTLLALINDILDLSKLDAGKIELNPTDFDPGLLFEDTLRLMRVQAEAKELELTYEPQADLPTRLRGDDNRIKQILINLIGNAVKFTDEGKVMIALASEELPDGRAMIRFSVKDTGVGIAEDKLSGIFERFTQADAAINRRYGGSGLGLSISRHLVNLMEGEISVASKPGQGSCFTVVLPLEQVEPAEEVVESPPLEESDLSSLAGLRLLVAEDNRVNRLLVEKFLKQAPIQTAYAENGAEAIDLARSWNPDVILMDVSMPVLDGVEATRIIRASDLRQPVIIALTANAFASDQQACLDAGMDVFLSKPIGREKLLLTLLATQSRMRELHAG